jgi:CheY-like chemotaxis protein
MKEALEMLRTSETSYDLVFVSQSFSKDEAASFIKNAKATNATQDAAFVILLKSSKDDDMATAMLIGFDGLLAEPYSVDSLNAMCELALTVKLERGAAREQAVLSMIVSNVSKQLDNVAILKACGYETARGMDKLKEACQSFKHLSAEAALSYEGIAEKVFGDAVPAKPPEKRYAGVSSRVKTKQVSKIVDGLV